MHGLSNRRFVHLEDKATLLDKDLGAEESGRVVCEAVVVAGFPSGEVQEVKVVPPVQVKHASLLVVHVDLDVVIHCVPGHVRIVESNLPLGELRSPEVHHERLWLRNQLDGRVKLTVGSHLTAID